MRIRDIFGWKLYFYEWCLPFLRRLGPERADAALAALARTVVGSRGSRRKALAATLERARAALGPSERLEAAGWADLAEGLGRFLARDYLLDTPDDAEALVRFDVSGVEALERALAAGRGVVLVGGHLGGHLSAFHWLFRRGVPLRLMVQRPKHVSAALGRFFDREGPAPQSGFFLRRGLGPADCVERLLRARAFVRSGGAVYIAGDIPWTSPNTRPGRLLGRSHRFLSVWADLSAQTGASVFHMFCNHAHAGRFALRFEPVGVVAPGEEDAAVCRFLARLEAAIADHPGDAVAHLLWPCYSSTAPDQALAGPEARPSRRAAAAPA